jgi:malate dehydrogenase (oxaloacetate-decarboxylating)(NADP+)
MFMAAHTLAEQVSEDDLRQGSLYPPLKNIRDVSAHIAAAVAYRRGSSRGPEPADLLRKIAYPAYVAS